VNLLPESIIFDVDGVLIDVRRSYNLAIKNTVTFILNKINPLLCFDSFVTDKIIAQLRQTGGFNNDVDTCYAILLTVLCNNQSAINEARAFVSYMTQNLKGLGIRFVEEFLTSRFSTHPVKKYKNLLNYPGSVGNSLLTTVFDEIFYGPQLFLMQHNIEPRYYFGEPLIDNDRMIIRKETMKKLSIIFDGRISIVTGRSRLAAEYSLESLYEYICSNACVFLDDESRKYAKPNPYALRRATEMLSTKSTIYVGDSMEDLLMAKKAEEYNIKTTFIGAYDYSLDPSKTIHQLTMNGADAIIKSVNQLPNMLNNANTEV
jgi:phosphoglycolate phosphatase-like HAD superfamily hydrolase